MGSTKLTAALFSGLLAAGVTAQAADTAEKKPAAAKPSTSTATSNKPPEKGADKGIILQNQPSTSASSKSTASSKKPTEKGADKGIILQNQPSTTAASKKPTEKGSDKGIILQNQPASNAKTPATNKAPASGKTATPGG